MNALPPTPPPDSPLPGGLPPAQAARRRWMAALALAPAADLEAAWAALPARPAHIRLRGPETGAALVRARAGGTGSRFNLGEMTVTRCAVRLACGTVGISYVAGRDGRHAELAALFDALFQGADGTALAERVAAPLEAAHAARTHARAAQAAASRVDFFTLVRGED